MLKAASFALAVAFAVFSVFFASGSAGASDLPGLFVGNVRDLDGHPIAAASVRLIDAQGRVVAEDRTDSDGTFAIGVADDTAVTRVATLMVACRYCRTVRRAAPHAGEDVTIFVGRFTALDSKIPTAGDLRALPYGRVADALSLVPYALPERNGGVSDRGLDGGRTLVVDDGLPISDAASRGDSALSDFPNRYASSLATIDPLEGYRYGTHAAGGAFVLDHLGDDATRFTGDVGSSHDAAAFARDAKSVAGLAFSGDSGMLARRADYDFDGAAFGGHLRAGYGVNLSLAPSVARNADLARIDYATASRRYVTIVDASLADVGVDVTTTAPNSYRSQYANASFRLERPNVVTIGIGAQTTLQNARYSSGVPDAYRLDGRIGDATLSADVATSSPLGSIRAGLGFTDVSERGALSSSRLFGSGTSLVPSIAGELVAGGGLSLHAGYAGGLDVPTLLDIDAASGYAESSFASTRTALSEVALRFDDASRVRAEIGAYHGVAGGFAASSVAGIGTNVAWQIAPRIALRAWTLLGTSSRSVAWATYANPDGGLRFDAIVRDEPAAFGAAHRSRALDVDVLVPIGSQFAVSIGSIEGARSGGRSATFGLRVNR